MAEPGEYVSDITEGITVIVHGYFEHIEQRTQCQNTHF